MWSPFDEAKAKRNLAAPLRLDDYFRKPFQVPKFAIQRRLVIS
jgi:hypothetical protein